MIDRRNGIDPPGRAPDADVRLGCQRQLMSGTEIVANQAATVLHGIPLRDGAGWVDVLLIVALGCRVPLLGLRGWA